MKTAILSWLQNDGTRGFSVDQLKGKKLSLMFQPDALVVFRAKDQMTRASGRNVGEVVSFNLVYREPSSSVRKYLSSGWRVYWTCSTGPVCTDAIIGAILIIVGGGGG